MPTRTHRAQPTPSKAAPKTVATYASPVTSSTSSSAHPAPGHLPARHGQGVFGSSCLFTCSTLVMRHVARSLLELKMRHANPAAPYCTKGGAIPIHSLWHALSEASTDIPNRGVHRDRLRRHGPDDRYSSAQRAKHTAWPEALSCANVVRSVSFVGERPGRKFRYSYSSAPTRETSSLA